MDYENDTWWFPCRRHSNAGLADERLSWTLRRGLQRTTAVEGALACIGPGLPPSPDHRPLLVRQRQPDVCAASSPWPSPGPQTCATSCAIT